MDNKTNGFSTNNGIYPTVLIAYDLQDCQPNGENKLYTYIDHSDDDDWVDEHEGCEAEYQIPNRQALIQLMDDICLSIHNEIKGYLDINSTPHDDASNDIWEAIDLLDNLRNFDFE